jgi:hypothetical protein
MSKALCLVLLSLGLAACGGKSKATDVPKVPTVSDAGTPLPPPDGMTGNPEQPPNTSGTTQN